MPEHSARPKAAKWPFLFEIVYKSDFTECFAAEWWHYPPSLSPSPPFTYPSALFFLLLPCSYKKLIRKWDSECELFFTPNIFNHF